MTGHGCRCVAGENDKGGRLVNLWAFSEENENNTTCDAGFPGEWSCPRQFDMQTILDDVVCYNQLKSSFIKVSIIWAFRPHGWTLE